MSNCWKSNAATQLTYSVTLFMLHQWHQRKQRNKPYVLKNPSNWTAAQLRSELAELRLNWFCAKDSFETDLLTDD